MLQSFHSILKSNRVLFQRLWHGLAILLVLVSNFGTMAKPVQAQAPEKSVEQSNQFAQSPLPVESYPQRPIFSRPEPKISVRPEQKKSPVSGNSNRIPVTAQDPLSAYSSQAKPIIASSTPTPTPDQGNTPQVFATIAAPSESLQTEMNKPSQESPSQTLMSESLVPIAGGHSPVIAYNSIQNETLVVWVDDTSLYGMRLSTDGTPLGSEFLIANSQTTPQHTPFRPKLSYNSFSNSYMLIWSELNGGTDTRTFCTWYLWGYCVPGYEIPWYSLSLNTLYALPLSNDGLPGEPTLVSNDVSFFDQSAAPAVVSRNAYDIVYNPNAHDFLLAWTVPSRDTNCFPYPQHLFAEHIGTDGVLGGPLQTPLVSCVVGDTRLGYSSADDLYLVTFDKNDGNDIYGQFFPPNLVPSGGSVTLTGNVSRWQVFPDLTYLPADDSYILTWFDERNYTPPEGADNGFQGDIRAKKISAANSGTPSAETVLLSSPPDGFRNIAPLAAYNASAGQALLLTGHNWSPDLVGQYVDSQAKPINQAFLPIANNVEEWGVAAIEQSDNPNWLVVWNSGGDIYVQSTMPFNGVYNGSVLNGGECNVGCLGGTQGTAGNPINTRTGGETERATDISIPTSAGPLAFERSYSSLATDLYNTTLGYGWTHNLDTHLIFPTDPGGMAGFVLFKAHSANRFQFKIIDDDLYAPAPGVLGSLSCSGTSPQTCELNLANQETYTFANKKLQTWEDGKGHSWIYEYYETNGQLKKVTDTDSARSLTLGYSQERITSVSDSEGRTVTFGYDDTNNDLVSVTGLDGTWTYEYDPDLNHPRHLLTKVIDPANQVVVRTVYDGQGRAIEQYDGKNNQVISLEYNSDGTTTITDANGNQSTHTYDANNTLISQSAPLTDPASKTYDPNNFRPNSIANPGQPATTLEWSTDGADLQYVMDPAGGETNIHYFPNHLPEWVIDAREFQTTYHYNADNLLDSLTYEFTPPQTYLYTYTTSTPLGLLETITDPQGQVIKYEYYADGQRKKIIENYDTGHGTNEAGLYNLTTTFTYDNLGQLITTTTPDNQVTMNFYNSAGRLIKVIRNFNNYPTHPKNFQDTDGNYYNIITEYTYDQHGNQIAVTDTYDMVTRSYYDENNRVVSVVQNLSEQGIEETTPPPFGTGSENIRRDTVYDADGKMIASIDPQGVITRTWYDEAGRPQYVVQNLQNPNNLAIESIPLPDFNPNNPGQNVRSETIYDPATGNAIASIDTYGKITRTYYDVMNRPVTVVENLDSNWDINRGDAPARNSNLLVLINLRTDMFYDANGNTIATTDPLNHTTRTWYDALNRPITVVQNLTGQGVSVETLPTFDPNHPDQNVRSDTYYDTAGRAYMTVDPLGRVTRTYYDAAGRAETVVRNLAQQYWNDSQAPDREVGNTDENLRTDTEYDANGRRISTTDALGHVTKYEYNTQGQLAVTIVNPLNGQADNYLSQYNLKTTYTYDALGRLLTTKDPLERVTATQYDGLGRTQTIIQNVLAGGPQNEYNLTTAFAYDPKGAQIAVTDPMGIITRSYYDAFGRSTSTVRNLSGQEIQNPLPPAPGQNETNLRADSAYDGLGRLKTATNELGKASNFEYDALGRQTEVADPLNHTTHSTYDAAGRLISSTNANGVVIGYEYDALGNLTAVIENYRPGMPGNDSTNVRTEYTYDAGGQRRTIKDANGHITSFTYFDTGLVETETDPLNHIWRYTYDKGGNRKSLVDAKEQTTNYTYDILNRLTLIDYPTPDFDVSFVYDAASRRTSMTDGLGVTTWEYDSLDRPILTTDPFNQTVTYTYDAMGNRASLTYPDGKVISYEYDDIDRLTQVTDWNSQSTSYTYNVLGRIVTVLRPNGVHSSYSYDDAGRLVDLQHLLGTQTLASYHYTYDSFGNRTNVVESFIQTSMNATIDYTYDSLNRLTQANYSTNRSHQYTYDAVGNRLSQITTVNGSSTTIPYTYDAANRLASVSGTAYNWDANGNLLRAGQTVYSYDTANRLTETHPFHSVSSSEQFFYNGLGDRLKYQRTDLRGRVTTTNYTLDLNAGLTQVLSDGAYTYTYGLERIAQVNATMSQYFLSDAIGSVRQLTDATGTVTLTKAYDPYGVVTQTSGSGASTYGYTGEITDPTGMVYLRARYYMPNTGRFLTRDTWQGDYDRPLSLNRWLYVSGNPINRTDPSGQREYCDDYDLDCDGYPDRPDPSWPLVSDVVIPDTKVPENTCSLDELVECFYRRAILRTGQYQISQGQMDTIMLAVFYDVRQRPFTLDGWKSRKSLDTPFWDNFTDPLYQSTICIVGGECYLGVEVNYLYQGMFSAKFEGPQLGADLVCAFKFLNYFEFPPSRGTFYWFGEGFDFYAKRTGKLTLNDWETIWSNLGYYGW